MITNENLLNYCLNNPTLMHDDNYVADKELIIIPRKASESNSLTQAFNSMNDLFTTLNTLNKNGDYSKDKELCERIVYVFCHTKHINYSPFNFYLQTRCETYDSFKKLSFENQQKLIKDYISDRHKIYCEHGYTYSMLQAGCDAYAHKRNGDKGTRLLRKQIESFGIKHFEYGNNNFYLNPDKGDEEVFKQMLSILKIKYVYYANKNAKLPDLFAKINDKYVIVEHKNMQSLGGHQNSVIADIMDFIDQEDDNVYYISYVDGLAFQKYFGTAQLGNSTNKHNVTNENLTSILKNHSRSYIVNAKGFEKLITEIL